MEPARLAAYGTLCREVGDCKLCLNDADIGPRMRGLSVFVPLPGPGPEPQGRPVRWLLVGAEPGDFWADSMAAASRRIELGLLNFAIQPADFALRFSARRWLCGPGEAFLLSDLARCAMDVDEARVRPAKRHRNCQDFLEREIRMFDLHAVIGLGSVARDRLGIMNRARGKPPWPWVPHWSKTNRPYRKSRLAGDREVGLPSLAELQAFIDQEAPAESHAKGHLVATNADRLLLATYWQEFEAIRKECGLAPL